MNCGVDIVDVKRFINIKDSFINKYFTKEEIIYIESKGNNAETIAGLYAAKEAFLKAIRVNLSKYALKDIEILHNNGEPILNINNKIKKEINKSNFCLSISHEKNYAIAFVIFY